MLAWILEFQPSLMELGGGFILLWIADMILKRFKAGSSDTFRWFVLHAITNGVVVLWSFPEVMALISNPLVVNMNVSTFPQNIVLILHVYHCVMFRNLQGIDWIHHLVMCFILWLVRSGSGGALVNYQLFFLSGFPGGIDYCMLILVKLGYMTSIREKELNAYINTWIRGPGILIGAVFIYIAYLMGTIPSDNYSVGYILLALYWNAQYFSARVVVNYGEKLGEKLSAGRCVCA